LIEEYVTQIKNIASHARTESKLEVEISQIFKNLLSEYSIIYDPKINESIKNSQRSISSTLRPDSLFGHVIMDYKLPGKLSIPIEIGKSKLQIEQYLNNISAQESNSTYAREKLSGILCDGFKFIFCHSANGEWVWTPAYEISKASLMTLVQTYRSLGKEPLNPTLLCRYFGRDSDVAKKVIPVLLKSLLKSTTKTELLYKEWLRLFEQASSYEYSQIPELKKIITTTNVRPINPSHILFVYHTYYSIVVKLLTAELLNCTNEIYKNMIVSDITNGVSYQEVFKLFRKLEDGEFYNSYRINNFLEGDFFSWYVNEESLELSDALLEIADTFTRFEPATPKLLPETAKDLLKEFYSGIMDEQIRHDLGEYYTPDWLAQYLLKRVGYTGGIGETCLDPACGSGTFLVECITLLRKECKDNKISPKDTLDCILRSIKGIDLNPLAVISSRANYILAIIDLLFELGEDVEIPVYLADAINIPICNDKGYYEFTLETEIGNYRLELPQSLVEQGKIGNVLLICEKDINRNNTPETFIEDINQIKGVKELLFPEDIQVLVRFYIKLQSLHDRTPPWDSIWCRIVKNNFAPLGINRCDYIIGNPPWVRWSRLPINYRNRVKWFCHKYGLVSGRGYSGGIESDISTVLLYSAVDNWLKIGGKVGVLITWTVFKSDSARGFRMGKLPNKTTLIFECIEDFSDIQPFQDATNSTGILIGSREINSTEMGNLGLKFKKITLPNNRRVNPLISLEEFYNTASITEGVARSINESGSPYFTGSESDFQNSHYLQGSSAYRGLAHRGTVNDLSRVFWVKVLKYSEDTNRALIQTLTTSELGKAREIDGSGVTWIEADLLFPLIRGRDVDSFNHNTKNWYQIIPNNHYTDILDENIFKQRFTATYEYLYKYNALLLQRSTYRRYLSRSPFYSIYCIGEYSFKKFKVVWPEQQDPHRFKSAVISENPNSIIPNKVFVPDHKLYFIGTDDEDEAHYLCAILNSKPVRTWLGGFLLDTQIGASIFDYLNVPMFQKDNPKHMELSSLSRKIHIGKIAGDIRKSSTEFEGQLEKLVTNAFNPLQRRE
jgi:hypothetical protein